jgi:hypothetical protein
MNVPPSLGEERSRRAAALLEAAGLRGPARLTPLTGGANNQVFRVDLDPPARPVLLKVYFVHPQDPRDRLRADYGFSRFAWDRGVRALAQPIAADPDGHLALFEFLPGGKLRPDEVSWPPVREALDFFLAVNAHRGANEARSLPVGSEACFTLQDHLHCVRRRVARLQVMETASAVDREALALVRGELTFLSDLVLHHTEERAAALGLAIDRPVPDGDRCLSPSDFGFHNALRTGAGMKFIDFEYAGWDDPGKTVADFFCQPECPVPAAFFEDFAEAVARQTADPALHLRRFRLLLPVYRLKWCCIMLNDFLAAGGSRRRFARDGEGEEERKARQLRKARAALRDVFPQGGRPRAA